MTNPVKVYTSTDVEASGLTGEAGNPAALMTTENIPFDLSRPLIYTSVGNIEIDRLEYKTSLKDCLDLKLIKSFVDDKLIIKIDKDGHLEFVEEYFLDGEVVKRNVHILRLKALESSFSPGNLN